MVGKLKELATGGLPVDSRPSHTAAEPQSQTGGGQMALESRSASGQIHRSKEW